MEHDPNEPSRVQTAFHALDADYQLALEEMAHTLATLGYQVMITEASPNVLKVEIWVINKN
jgi:hypothetical protein